MRATCSCAIFIISGVMPGNPAIVASEEATRRLAMWPLLALRPTMSERHVITVSEHSRALCLVMQAVGAAGLLGRLTLLRAGRAGRSSRHVSACCRPSGVRASLLAGTGAEVPAVREVLCRRSVGAGRRRPRWPLSSRSHSHRHAAPARAARAGGRHSVCNRGTRLAQSCACHVHASTDAPPPPLFSPLLVAAPPPRACTPPPPPYCPFRETVSCLWPGPLSLPKG